MLARATGPQVIGQKLEMHGTARQLDVDLGVRWNGIKRISSWTTTITNNNYGGRFFFLWVFGTSEA
jgi:hypothetical protein